MPPRSALIGLLLLSFLAPADVRAQDRPFPYEADRGIVLAPMGAGLWYLGHEMVARVDGITPAEIAPLRAADINGFDRWATENWSPSWQDRSDVLRSALVGSAMLMSASPAFSGDWSQSATLGLMYAEVSALVLGIGDITKALTGRKRPYLYNESLSVQERADIVGNRTGWAYLSLFSGHAATSFAAATFLSTVFTDVYGPSALSKAVWGASLSTATLVAYARVEGGAHFPSDVVIGAMVGSAIGYLVPRLHRQTPNTPVSIGVAPSGVSIRLALP